MRQKEGLACGLPTAYTDGSTKENYQMKTGIFMPAAAFLLGGAMLTSNAITFDFRANFAGGNVGDSFDGSTSGSATIDGVTINGSVTAPGGAPFNINFGSADLGIGVNSGRGDRPTQIDVSEVVAFDFDTLLDIQSITLQVFFLSSSDGQGGPVATHDDAISITIGGETHNIVSPVIFQAGDSTFYTIDIGSVFSNTILNPGEELVLAPSAGDGLRLRSIEVGTVTTPEAGSSCQLLGLALAGFGGFQFISTKKRSR
jgi:hypothetical protein